MVDLCGFPLHTKKLIMLYFKQDYHKLYINGDVTKFAIRQKLID